MDTVSMSKLVDMIARIEPVGSIGVDVYAWRAEVYSAGLLVTESTLAVERYVSLRDYWPSRLAKVS